MKSGKSDNLTSFQTSFNLTVPTFSCRAVFNLFASGPERALNCCERDRSEETMSRLSVLLRQVLIFYIYWVLYKLHAHPCFQPTCNLTC